MEACIIICRTRKDIARKKSILFINAIKEVTRKNAESYLEDSHIDNIVQAYNKGKGDNSFCKLVPFTDIETNNFDLTISLYVHGFTLTTDNHEDKDIESCVINWRGAHDTSDSFIRSLIALLK